MSKLRDLQSFNKQINIGRFHPVFVTFFPAGHSTWLCAFPAGHSPPQEEGVVKLREALRATLTAALVPVDEFMTKFEK